VPAPHFFQLTLMPQSLITAQSKDILAGMLMRGFTTVRDAGGADTGLVQAVERGHFIGPRLFIAGRAITQTGGMAIRRRSSRAIPAASAAAPPGCWAASPTAWARCAARRAKSCATARIRSR
jgi:imidazolonepropionase-like amidohydrolase